jgi:hypothetical protein
VPAEIKPKRVPAKERERERSRGIHLSFRFLGNHILREREREGAYV